MNNEIFAYILVNELTGCPVLICKTPEETEEWIDSVEGGHWDHYSTVKINRCNFESLEKILAQNHNYMRGFFMGEGT